MARHSAVRSAPAAILLDQVMSVFMGPGGHAVCYYLRGGELLNFAGTVEAPVLRGILDAQVPLGKP